MSSFSSHNNNNNNNNNNEIITTYSPSRRRAVMIYRIDDGLYLAREQQLYRWPLSGVS